MKRCPKCGRSYYDEGINFCLDDGTPLFSSSQTAVSQETQMTVVSGLNASGSSIGKTSNKTKIILLVGFLATVFLLFVVGVGALLFYFASTADGTGAGISNTRQPKAQQPSNSRLSDDNNTQDRLADEEVSKQEEAASDENSSDDRSSDVEQAENEANEEKADVDTIETEKELVEDEDKNETNSLEGKYVGSATNLTFNQTTGLSIRISQNGSTIGGRVNVSKPALGSGNIISGYTDGKNISFVSYDSKNDITIYWEGRIKKNSMEGSYTATTSNPYLQPNTQYGTWRVRRE
ncbi:MAG: hypothetical protein D6687_09720 [Acidobacteria bacterium]|jgi:hypothetical protein|nr:MAG: hypothetical protein D6687_09720 [Acidobacteriota bacterium]GIU81302.1 MAG: hypothetical protein KatS3mg006_0366 [Pyrinomonadaceae bacterium]